MEHNYTEDDFIKGINHFGQQEEKKQLAKIQAALEQEGFFEQNADLISGITQQGEKQLRKNIAGVQTELEQEGFFEQVSTQPKRSLLPLFRIGLAAASIILLIWVGRNWLFVGNGNQSSTERIALEDISEVPKDLLSENIAKELSESGFGGAPQKALLQELEVAMQHYQKADYVTANQQLQAILETPIVHPFIAYNKFYLAITYLEIEQPQKAIQLFEQLKRSEKIDQNAVRWYLALAFQQAAEPQKAKQVLNDWQPFGVYKQKKQQLLKLLD